MRKHSPDSGGDSLRRFWSFGAHPRTYDLESAVVQSSKDYWTIGEKKDVKKGDRVAFWKFAGSSKRAGVVALGEVLTDPKSMRLSAPGFWKSEGWRNVEPRVLVVYVPIAPLWLPEHPELPRLAIARARGGSVYQMSAEDWTWLLEVALGWPSESART